jgi:hypothetical protein
MKGEKPKDIDVFFKNTAGLMAAKNAFTGAGIKISGGNAWVTNYNVDGYTVQFVEKHFFKDVPTLFNAFDFTFSAACYDGICFHCGPAFNHATENRHLCLLTNNPRNPVGSLRRAFRFVERGYKLDPYVIEKLAVAISNLTENDILDHFYDDPDGTGDI